MRNRHPWIFSGAVKTVPPGAAAGEIISVSDEDGKIFARAAFNPKSDIVLRIISRDAGETIDETWFLNRLKTAAALKERLLCIGEFPEDKKNYRLIYSEADGVPGLVIDRYGKVFVIQCQTLFADKNRMLWLDIIKKLFRPSAVFEKSDAEVRKREGLTDMPSGLLYGALEKDFFIDEDGFKINIDISGGQKTGFFLDLRGARRRVEHWCRALGTGRLQNYFGYTGGFGLYAARAGVKKMEHIDSSAPANLLAEENFRMNGFDGSVKIITSDAFEYLNKTENGSVDGIILDPPSFVKRRENINNALDGYRRLNSAAMAKLSIGGLLVTFCCSSYVSEDDFRKVLFKASSSAGCGMRVLERTGHDPDHTLLLDFPEGRYLQGWILLKE